MLPLYFVSLSEVANDFSSCDLLYETQGFASRCGQLPVSEALVLQQSSKCLNWNELYWSNCAQTLDGAEETALVVGRMGFYFTKVCSQLSILIKASSSMHYIVPHFIINYWISLHTMTAQTNRLHLVQNKVSYNRSAYVLFCFVL